LCAVVVGTRAVECWNMAPPPSDVRALRVASGSSINAAILPEGGLRVWGGGSDYTTPGNFLDVAATDSAICAVRAGDGRITCTGDSSNGLWTAPNVAFRAITGRYTTFCGLRQDGGIDCWGSAGFGPRNAPDDTDFIDLSVGIFHACGLHADGRMQCWGATLDQQDMSAAAGQSAIPADPSYQFTSIASGYSHNCGWRLNGGVVCWGQGGSTNLPSTCGNEVVEPWEACDDGVEAATGLPESGDGCSADCKSSEVCGNGVVDVAEYCDDNRDWVSDSCDAACQEKWSEEQLVPAPDVLFDFDQDSLYGDVFLNYGAGSWGAGSRLGAVTIAPGRLGEAVNFSGEASDRVRVADATHQDGGVTVVAWIKQTGVSLSTSSELVVHRGGGGPLLGWTFGTAAEAPPGLSFAAGSSSVSTSSLAGNTWTHVAATFDPSSGDNILYVDGQVVAAVSSPGAELAYGTGSELSIGRGFRGAIDELAVFGQALPAEMIANLHHMGTEGRALALQVPREASSMPCASILAADPSATDGIYDVPLGPTGALVPVYCDMSGGGWTLVYKKSSGVPNLANALWDLAPVNDTDEALLDVGADAADYASRLLRHPRALRKLRVAVVVGAQTVRHIVFDGHDLGRGDWFAPGRVLDTDWTGLPRTPNYQGSAVGRFFTRQSAWIDRSFFINQTFGGCSSDSGFLVVTGSGQSGTPCAWEQQPYRILYSSQTGAQSWDTASSADALLIFAR